MVSFADFKYFIFKNIPMEENQKNNHLDGFTLKSQLLDITIIIANLDGTIGVLIFNKKEIRSCFKKDGGF